MAEQTPAVQPPGQLTAVQALSGALDGVRVSTVKPESPGERFVIVSRIGGGSQSFATADPRFLVECYAPTELEAEQFCLQVVAAWKGLRSHNIIRAYDDGNIVPLNDPDTRYYRFQFTGGLKIGIHRV